MPTQKQVGKLPESSEQNEEVALDFAGPFQNAKKGKKYLLVSINHYSGCPEAKFLHRSTIFCVLEFLKQYIAQYGVPRKIRTDPGTIFVSEAFIQFCNQFGIQHVGMRSLGKRKKRKANKNNKRKITSKQANHLE